MQQVLELKDPHAYALLLVSALVTRGAEAVEIRYGRGWLNLRAEVEPWTAEEMEQLFECFFAGQTDRSQSELALGLNCALAIDPQRLVVESRLLEETVQWDLIGNQMHQELPHRATGVVIRIERRSGLKSWLRNLRGYAGMPAECRLVDQQCEYAPLPVVINYARINRPIVLGEAPAVVRLGEMEALYQATFVFRRSLEGLEGALALGSGEIEWVIDGVSSGKTEGRGLRGVVASGRLNRDLSRRLLLEDEAYEQLMKQLEELRDMMVEHLCAQLEGILEEMLPEYLEAIEAARARGTRLSEEATAALTRAYGP